VACKRWTFTMQDNCLSAGNVETVLSSFPFGAITRRLQDSAVRYR
jgi:hypothetical protein